MNILFIHQNFPGQYKNLAPALAARGDNCVALTLRVKEPTNWKGVRVLPYQITRKPGDGVHPWLVDLNTKVHRAEACMLAALKLKDAGFSPDVIVAHPGWVESLFLRDVWPEARIGLYYELFYQADAADSGFDPEFSRQDDALAAQRIRLKNVNNQLHLPLGDMGICPTEFQAASFPKAFRDRISVIHDGIDTKTAKPNPDASFELPDGGRVTRSDQVITFVNRNLEPYRGFHIFMRALPQILRDSPKARVLIVGGEERSYGPAAPDGRSWKDIFRRRSAPTDPRLGLGSRLFPWKTALRQVLVVAAGVHGSCLSDLSLCSQLVLARGHVLRSGYCGKRHGARARSHRSWAKRANGQFL